MLKLAFTKNTYIAFPPPHGTHSPTRQLSLDGWLDQPSKENKVQHADYKVLFKKKLLKN